ncbi:histone-lysine N-methyltransferase, H3 lysine-9 specific SUVH4-like [Aristolochia californica]|uniref:histone-lysine N-methyltransferase, H3 lysine-9 specific SUVH4-like n=1 Tax=Aristolochia californica TaxID=171875 RepID=UPI0035DA2632
MRNAILTVEGVERRDTPGIETKMKLKEERIQKRSSGIYHLKRKRPVVLPTLTDRAACYQVRSEMYTPEEVEYTRVEETLKIFNAYYHVVNFKKIIKRPDLKAISIMKQSNVIHYPKGIESLKGIDVGHRFFSRAEMVVVGLHGHWMNCIDFIGVLTIIFFFEYSHYRFSIAVSVVIYGQYEDNLDNLEEVIYTGVGGNNFMRSDHHNLDQKLTGVYKVVEYWNEKGVSGSNVWKYRLKRLQ